MDLVFYAEQRLCGSVQSVTQVEGSKESSEEVST
jgi:hypothetical protein